MDRRLENHCHYSGLPSPQAYESNEQINKIETNMKNKLQQYYPLLLAFVSFLFSVGLWFTGYKQEGLFVGIWVPSILACGCFLNTINK